MKKIFATAILSGLIISGTAQAAPISLTGVIRDFTPSTNSDFENPTMGSDKNIVKSTLGVDGKPVYNDLDSNPTVHSATTFNQWYNNVYGVNKSEFFSISLNDNDNDGVYTYSNSSFFPIDGQLFGNYGSHNYHFTYELHTDFTYQAGQKFTFTGDDDLWVFINGQLVIDLGGIHGAETASVLLDSLGLTSGSNYTFDLFFAERHTVASNFRIDTSIKLNETSPVPEPSTILLFGVGAAGLAGIARRKRS